MSWGLDTFLPTAAYMVLSGDFCFCLVGTSLFQKLTFSLSCLFKFKVLSYLHIHSMLYMEMYWIYFEIYVLLLVCSVLMCYQWHTWLFFLGILMRYDERYQHIFRSIFVFICNWTLHVRLPKHLCKVCTGLLVGWFSYVCSCALSVQSQQVVIYLLIFTQKS